jgi:hypothetical protein
VITWVLFILSIVQPRPRLSTDTLPAYSQEYIAEGSDGSIETESSVSATTTNYLELPHVNGHRPVNGNGFPNGHSYSPNQRRNGTTPHDPQPGPSSTPTLRTSRSMTSMPPDHPVNYIRCGHSGACPPHITLTKTLIVSKAQAARFAAPIVLIPSFLSVIPLRYFAEHLSDLITGTILQFVLYPISPLMPAHGSLTSCQ